MNLLFRRCLVHGSESFSAGKRTYTLGTIGGYRSRRAVNEMANNVPSRRSKKQPNQKNDECAERNEKYIDHLLPAKRFLIQWVALS